MALIKYLTFTTGLMVSQTLGQLNYTYGTGGLAPNGTDDSVENFCTDDGTGKGLVCCILSGDNNTTGTGCKTSGRVQGIVAYDRRRRSETRRTRSPLLRVLSARPFITSAMLSNFGQYSFARV